MHPVAALALRPPMGVLEGIQSALNPQGPHADVVAEIAWVLFIGGFAIFAIVAVIAAYAIFASRENATRLPTGPLVVGGGIVFPVVVLSALLVYTMLRAGSLAPDSGKAALRIEVTGEQWWWRVRYLDDAGKADFETANEIRIPVGRPVELALKSADVIHSFWVPTLAGKLDMIPGRTHHLRITAHNPGQYRGQCAEYCGGPHAFMAFLVIAEPPDRYAEWAARERMPAATPNPGAAAPGEKLFVAHCATCHTIRGTPAQGTLGPDLTHLATRLTLAAGVLPNNAGTLAGWIASSQHLKPGNLMPSFRQFHGEELRALARYLGSLE